MPVKKLTTIAVGPAIRGHCPLLGIVRAIF